MPIRSKLIPPERGILDVALETETGDGMFFVGLGLGRVVRGEMKLNDTGERCFRRIAEHSRDKRPDGAIHIVCVEHFPRARRELHNALAAANEGDMVFFVCVDGTIYDAMFTQLHIAMRAGLLATH
jgi:hypothetical protein